MVTDLTAVNQNNHNHPDDNNDNDDAAQDQTDNSDLPLLDSKPSPDRHHRSKNPSPAQSGGDSAFPSVTEAELEEMEKKFAAFVRHDVYGPMGRGDLPLSEKLLLFLALIVLVPLRIVLGLSILVLYYLICKVCTLLLRGDPTKSSPEEEERDEDRFHLRGWRRWIVLWSGRCLSRALLFVLGFYWISRSCRDQDLHNQGKLIDENESKDHSEELECVGAIVSNHVSHLDILYHMSASFPSFVAKRSVGKLPLVGLISKCLGCVYVQREDKSSDFKGVAEVVTERILEAHHNADAPLMLLFPEGTTTNGDFILPFKTGAFIAGTPVRPVILNYPYRRFSPAWDSISGVRHVIFLLCQFVNFMEVTSLPIYYPSKEEKGNPKVYANNVRKLMAKEGNLILSDIGLPEKRIYHTALDGFMRYR